MAFDWGSVLGPVITGATALVGQQFGIKAQEDAADKAFENEKKQALFELEMAKLKDQYGLNGGGGGGGKGGGGGGGDSRALLINAYNNYLNSQQEDRAQLSNAYTNMIAAVQRPLLGGK